MSGASRCGQLCSEGECERCDAVREWLGPEPEERGKLDAYQPVSLLDDDTSPFSKRGGWWFGASETKNLNEGRNERQRKTFAHKCYVKNRRELDDAELEETIARLKWNKEQEFAAQYNRRKSRFEPIPLADPKACYPRPVSNVPMPQRRIFSSLPVGGFCLLCCELVHLAQHGDDSSCACGYVRVYSNGRVWLKDRAVTRGVYSDAEARFYVEQGYGYTDGVRRYPATRKAG